MLQGQLQLQCCRWAVSANRLLGQGFYLFGFRTPVTAFGGGSQQIGQPINSTSCDLAALGSSSSKALIAAWVTVLQAAGSSEKRMTTNLEMLTLSLVRWETNRDQCRVSAFSS